MAGIPSDLQWTGTAGTAGSKHDRTGVSMCPSSLFLAGFARWSLVCHVQHPILGNEITGLCHYFTRWHTHIPSSENLFASLVTGDVYVCVPWLPVQG